MAIALTLAVVAIALTLFVGEWFPPDQTALMVMLTLIVLGLVSPEEGFSGFSNSATLTVMAMFILSAGIARTGAVQNLTNFLIRWGGDRVSQQILVMGAIVAPLSGFLNNTAVVAVFLPVVEEWCHQRKISPSKLLMPLSYVTIFGGMITLFGTSTNLLGNGIIEQLDYQPFGIFEFSLLGLLTGAIGLLYLAFVAAKWLPDRTPHGQNRLEQYGLGDYLSEMVIPPNSELIGQSLQKSQIQRQFDLDVLELVRQGFHFPQPFADKPLVAGDILIVRGQRECLLRVKAEKGIQLLADVKFHQDATRYTLNSPEEGIAELVLLPNAPIVGSTLKETRFRQRYNVTVLAIKRGESVVRDRLGRVPLRFGDVLLVQGPKQSLLGLQTAPGWLLTEQRDLETLRTEKAAIASLLLLGVVIVATLEILPILVTAWLGVISLLLTGCLKPGEIYTAVRWDIIFLLAGLIPLGIAMEKSGATAWLAKGLVFLGQELSGYWLLTIFFLITSLITEILSNNACVVLILPIAVRVAESLQLNPYAFMLVVIFAASNSFMTPIGYQTNTMVYGPGGYRFRDFLRVGTPLNFLMALVTPPLIILLFGL